MDASHLISCLAEKGFINPTDSTELSQIAAQLPQTPEVLLGILVAIEIYKLNQAATPSSSSSSSSSL